MAESVKIESLTDEEKKFIEKYRQLDDAIKETVLEILELSIKNESKK